MRGRAPAARTVGVGMPEWEGVRRPGNATKILFFFRGGEGDHDDDDDDDCVWIGGHARRAEMDAFG